tara:strand:+ start:5653 stop:5922 length:270 start_codon:yes stop_codon:yes gene_type:complete
MKNEKTIGESFIELILAITHVFFTVGKALFWTSLFLREYHDYMDLAFSYSLVLILIHLIVKFVCDTFINKLITLIKVGAILFVVKCSSF